MAKESIVHRFGQRVRQLRGEADLSQEELAYAADLDRTYISGIERGTRNISLKTVEALATALNVPVAELFPDE